MMKSLVLAGGTAFPGCARLTCYFGTGWKACATDLKNFSGQGGEFGFGQMSSLFFLL
jgi:hypothetical protein